MLTNNAAQAPQGGTCKVFEYIVPKDIDCQDDVRAHFDYAEHNSDISKLRKQLIETYSVPQRIVGKRR